MNVLHSSLVRYAKCFAQLKNTKCEKMVSARWLRCFTSISHLSDLYATPGPFFIFLFFFHFAFDVVVVLLLFLCPR